jgi:hypothetical protein
VTTVNDHRFELREKARQGIQSGKLPTRRPSDTWGGFSSGALCPVCDLRLSPGDVEIEIQVRPEGAANGEAYMMHVACYAAWEAELPVGAARVVSSGAANSPRGTDVAHDEAQSRTGES